MKRIAKGMLILVMILSLTACGTEKQPAEEKETETETNAVTETPETPVEPIEKEETADSQIETAVGEFQYACQTSDVDARLECLDPGFAQSLKSGRLLLNWMSTEDNADEVIMKTILISVLNVADIAVDWTTINIEIKEIKAEEEVATVESTMTMESSTDDTYKDEIIIRMSKNDDKWYITGITT